MTYMARWSFLVLLMGHLNSFLVSFDELEFSLMVKTSNMNPLFNAQHHFYQIEKYLVDLFSYACVCLCYSANNFLLTKIYFNSAELFKLLFMWKFFMQNYVDHCVTKVLVFEKKKSDFHQKTYFWSLLMGLFCENSNL